MSESNPQTPFKGLGGSLGCMAHSQTRTEVKGRRDGRIDKLMHGDGKMEKGHRHKEDMQKHINVDRIGKERGENCIFVSTYV